MAKSPKLSSSLTARVLIPVKVGPNGEMRYLYGGVVPKLKPGAVGDLFVQPSAIADSRVVELLNAEEIVPMLATDTELFVIVSPTGSGASKPGVEKRDLLVKGQLQDVVVVVAKEEQRLSCVAQSRRPLSPQSGTFHALVGQRSP